MSNCVFLSFFFGLSLHGSDVNSLSLLPFLLLHSKIWNSTAIWTLFVCTPPVAPFVSLADTDVVRLLKLGNRKYPKSLEAPL